MKKPRRMRGYYDGGEVYDFPDSPKATAGPSVADRIKSNMQAGALISKALSGGFGAQAAGAAGGSLPMAKGGGKIKRVAGKPIGKDDGLIAAQRGEYVIRKAAVKKLGTKALDQVNKGKLPAKGRGR